MFKIVLFFKKKIYIHIFFKKHIYIYIYLYWNIHFIYLCYFLIPILALSIPQVPALMLRLVGENLPADYGGPAPSLPGPAEAQTVTEMAGVGRMPVTLGGGEDGHADGEW